MGYYKVGEREFISYERNYFENEYHAKKYGYYWNDLKRHWERELGTIAYNTHLENFNRWNFDTVSDMDLIEYAKLWIEDASEKEKAMNENDTYNNNYKFACSASNVSHIMNELDKRGLIKNDFKFGVVGMGMYDAENVGALLNLFNRS